MELRLNRYGNTSSSSGGALSINGQFFCHTCEDAPHPEKIPRETRIPEGHYEIKLRDEGGMNEEYKNKHSFHRGMLHLQFVPGFQWVYIHPGNNAGQTEGCILVGFTANSCNGFSLGRSEMAYTTLYKQILSAIDRGERVHITIE